MTGLQSSFAIQFNRHMHRIAGRASFEPAGAAILSFRVASVPAARNAAEDDQCCFPRPQPLPPSWFASQRPSNCGRFGVRLSLSNEGI